MNNSIKPIQKIEDVNRLRKKISKNPRDLLLFCLITETGLRLGDVLKLKVKHLDGLRSGDPLPISKTPTEYDRKPIVTQRIEDAFANLRKEKSPFMEDPLFRSKKGNAPLEPTSVSRLVSQWFKQANLEGLTGIKSLRKTWKKHFRDRTGSVESASNSNGESIYGRLTTSKMSDQIHSKLLDLILTGRLAPGKRLVAQHIAEEMHISPMPVRDALNHLEANGFVLLHSNRSYYVNSLSKKDLIEITEMRMILEPIAAVKASTMASDQEIADIIKIADRFQKAVDTGARDTYEKTNREFHFKLYNCANNQAMILSIHQLWNMLSPYQYLLSEKSRSHNFTEGGYKNHQEIISAVQNRNAKSLDYWVRMDITFAFNGIMAEFKE